MDPMNPSPFAVVDSPVRPMAAQTGVPPQAQSLAQLIQLLGQLQPQRSPQPQPPTSPLMQLLQR